MSYSKPDFEVAGIAREFGPKLVESGKLTGEQKKVLTNICQCRTAELGGHKEVCSSDSCNYERYAYNGCRNRHCPKCNGLKREKWIAARKADALPVPYFHIVFTIPASLEPLCLSNGKELYNLLFRSAWDTISFFSSQHKHLGAEMGMVAILHTWGQNLARHTHLHCLVPAGGLTVQNSWRPSKKRGKFFVHVKKLSKVFRGKFTDGLIDLQNHDAIHMEVEMIKGLKHIHPLFAKNWVVYAKKPMPTSDKVVEYIGRYSHRVAIGNHRIKEVKDGGVSFSWMDYRTGKTGIMPLKATEFLHRFLLHVLPSGFVKIRHYGILSTRNKSLCITRIREFFQVPQIPNPLKGKSSSEVFEALYGRSPKTCPCCGKGTLMVVEVYLPRHLQRSRDGPDLRPNLAFCKQQA